MWWLKPVRLLRQANTRICMFDTLDFITGNEKKEFLAYLSGDCDPFRIIAIKKGPGTWERPNLIPSAFPSRYIACVCHPLDNHVEYMALHQGCPKRCGCGYWFVLCPVTPLL